jgi:hypothetical protein
MRKLIAAALGTACFIAAGAAGAAPMTFFGEDLGLGEDTRLSSTPNSDAAQANFLSSLGNLGGVGTETFENLAVGTGLPLTLSFPGTGTATLTDRFSYADAAVAEVPSGTNGVGRYPISGTKYLESSSNLQVTFSSPVAAFGFYGVDIGDFVGPVTLTFADGEASTVNIGNTVNQLGGSALFFGYIDVENPFTSVSFGVLFGNEAGSTDFFGLDDLTVGSVAQVTPVSEPISIALFGSGLIGLFMLRRQRNA